MSDEAVENSSLPGSRLREQRERKGLSVSQAASELHVDRRLLEALEDDRFDDIGAPIFVKGHLRNYARLLELDPGEVVAAYEAAGQPDDPALVAQRPDGPRMEPGQSHAWVGWLGWLFLLLLAVLLGSWWYYEQEGGGELVLSPASESDSVSISAPPEDTAGPPVAVSPSRQESGFPEDAGEQSGSESAEGLPPEGPAAAGQSDTPAEGGPEVVTPETREDVPAGRAEESRTQESRTVTPPTAPAGGQGLVLEFSEESWVEIYDAEGRPILYELMTPGTRREINASGELRVFLGNADGVDVTVAGEEFNVTPYRRRDSTARFTVNVPAAD